MDLLAHSDRSFSGKERLDRSHGLVDVLGRGLRAHRERNDFPTDLLGFGQPWVLQREPFVMPHRLWPMNERFHSLCLQMLTEPIASSRSHHVVLKDIDLPLLAEMGQLQLHDSLERLSIARGDPPTMLDPVWEVAQLDVQNCSLHVVKESRVSVIVILARLAVFAIETQ